MLRKDTFSWIFYFTRHMHKTQSKTLCDLVSAVLYVSSVSIAEIGRKLSQRTAMAAKHGIKRADRFLSNERIEPSEAMRKIGTWLAGPSRRLIVSIDWVDIRPFACVLLSAWPPVRAVPLFCPIVRREALYRRQNYIAYG